MNLITARNHILVLMIITLVGDSNAAFMPSRFNAARLVPNTHIHTSSRLNEEQRKDPNHLLSRLSARGGEEALEEGPESGSSVLSDSGLSAENIAKLFSSIIAVKGSLFGVVPSLTFNELDPDIKNGTLAFSYAQNFGITSIGTAVTSFLSIAGETSVERAIGFGLLPRIAFVLQNLMGGFFQELGMENTKLFGFGSIASGCAYSLISGKGKPLAAAKAVSFISGIVSASMVFNTAKTGKMITCIDLDEEGNEKAKGWYKKYGHAIFVSAVQIGSLSFGVKPITALGHAALASSVMNLESFVCKDYEKTGMSRNLTLSQMVITGLFALRLFFA